MKKNCNRLIALLLSFGMVLSLCGNAALAAQSDPAPEISALAEEVSGQDGAESSATDQGAEDAQSQGEVGDGSGEDQSAQTAQAEGGEDSSVPEQEDVRSDEEAEDAGAEVSADEEEVSQDEEPREDAAPEELSVQEEPQNAEEYKLNITQSVDMSLEYDDRFSFSTVGSGYVVAQITEQNPTSYVVSAGKVTSTKDAVITMSNGSATQAVATGTGTAAVVMVKKADLADAQTLLSHPENATRSVDALQVNVTVQSAPLTIMFLGGQSNMEGWGAKSAYQQPGQSIVCPEGEVYSTYAPGDTAYARGRANSIGGGVSFTYDCTVSNVNKFVAESLTSNYSIDGTKLVYRLNQLTAPGTGKSGPDSGLAYEWNRLTGDKVWTVNAAVGSSSIKMWAPGKKCYNRARAIYSAALSVCNAEIAAGHYTQSHRLFFWLQGEADRKLKASNYFNSFEMMHKYMKQSLGFEQFGIISVRASTSSKHYRDSLDLIMTGPRIVQSYLANTNRLRDVHIVSDVNERWCTDNGVKSYFKSVYGSAVNYKTQSSTPSLPTKVSQVHNDIHYSQVAHNENGLTAARGMYKVITGTAQPSSVRWRNDQGKTVTSLKLSKGESVILSPAVNEVAASKRVSWKFSSGLKYSASSAKLTVTGSGKQQIQAIAPDGKVISTLTVSASGLSAPTLSSAKNVKGKKISAKWKKSKGAAGYQVQCSTKENFSGGTKSASSKKTSATIKGLKSGKTYYVRVRAWQKKGGKKVYSSWSAVKTVKVSQ